MPEHILENIKAYVAVLAAIIPTVAALVPANSQVHAFLIGLGLVLAGIVVQKSPANKPKPAAK